MFCRRPQGPAQVVVQVPITSRNMACSNSSVAAGGNCTWASARNSSPGWAASSCFCTVSTSNCTPTRDWVGLPVDLSQMAAAMVPAISSWSACTSMGAAVWAANTHSTDRAAADRSRLSKRCANSARSAAASSFSPSCGLVMYRPSPSASR